MFWLLGQRLDWESFRRKLFFNESLNNMKDDQRQPQFATLPGLFGASRRGCELWTMDLGGVCLQVV